MDNKEATLHRLLIVLVSRLTLLDNGQVAVESEFVAFNFNCNMIVLSLLIQRLLDPVLFVSS